MRAWAYCEAYAFLIPVASTSAREGGTQADGRSAAPRRAGCAACAVTACGIY